MENKIKVAIIDCDSLMYSIANPIKVLDEYGNFIMEGSRFKKRDKTLDEMISTSITVMNSILTDTLSTHYIMYIKGENTTDTRLSVNSDYKKNRTLESPSWWNPLKKFMIDKYKTIEIHNMEVDDAVLITHKSIPNSFICAIDKDLLNIEGTHYNFRKKQWLYNTKESETVYLSKQMIEGDTIDNIKGIPGCGTAYFNNNLLNKIKDEKDFYLVLKEYIKNYSTLNEAIDQFYKNFKCLYILREKEGFIVPNPIEYNKLFSD